MKRPKITLRSGEEIIVNGLVIRGIGAPVGQRVANQLSIYHPNAFHVIEAKRDPRKHIYAGLTSTPIACGSTMCIGLVGELADTERERNLERKEASGYLASLKP